MTNRSQATCWITTLVIFLVGLECRLGMADPVSVDSLFLKPQSSLPANLSIYGNRIGRPYHETSLKRVEDDVPWPESHGGLLQMHSSLDVNGESWAIAEKGDHFSWGGGVGIPYVSEREVPPPPAVIPSEVFYVAFVWGYNFFGGTGSEVFGWAKLQAAPPLPPSPGNPFGAFNPDLILLASATTTDDRGIVVGEYRVVPEPSSAACACVALLGLSMARNGLTTRRTNSPGPSPGRH